MQKSNFGLTAAEILMATDAELNEYIGIKKLTPYRKGRDRWDNKQVERLRNFREKVQSRTGTSQWTVASVEHAKKKRKGRKERERARVAAVATEADGLGASSTAQ